MKVFHSRDGLRLAARTLIEWRTPKTSPAFAEVLHDVLVDHPIASHLGIQRAHELFSLDDQGVLLWFLSETMDSPVPTRVVPETNTNKQIALLFDKQIYRDGAVGYSDSELWPRGPLKSQVVDAILRGLSRKDSLSGMALVAITIPLPLGVQKKYVGLTNAQYKVNWRILERLSARLTSLTIATRGLSKLSAVLAVGSTAISAIVALTDRKPGLSHPPSFANFLGFLISAVTFMLIDRIVSATLFRRLIMKLWTREPKTAQPASASLSQRKIVRIVRPDRSILRENRLKSPIFKQVRAYFNQMCAAESGVFQFILEHHQETVWADAAFSANTPLSKRVKRELILLLRSPELSEWSKFRLLSRLCD